MAIRQILSFLEWKWGAQQLSCFASVPDSHRHTGVAPETCAEPCLCTSVIGRDVPALLNPVGNLVLPGVLALLLLDAQPDGKKPVLESRAVCCLQNVGLGLLWDG